MWLRKQPAYPICACCCDRRWMVRAPLVLVATSELVKLRFVVVQQSQVDDPNAFGYFFWLYCAYVLVQVRCNKEKRRFASLVLR